MKSSQLVKILLAFVLISALLLAPASGYAAKPLEPTVTIETGQLGGAYFTIAFPSNWNGTLLLCSHGYGETRCSAIGQLARDYLLQQGYALAESSFSTGGWDVKEALLEDMALLGYFASEHGKPTRTIAWGTSLGGLITAGLMQRYPSWFDGALELCGVLGGGVGAWNAGLDLTFAFKTLLAPDSSLQLVNVQQPNTNATLGSQILAAAQGTAQGRARVALAAALMDVPGWFDSAQPEPAVQDYAAREFNQYLWLRYVDLPFLLGYRAELEARAGGNPSWNTEVNYRVQLAHSSQADLVNALYEQAGLSLDDDLETLQKAPRIAADPNAVAYLEQNINPDGQIQTPVLTMHTTGDGLAPVEHEQAYARLVRAAGNQELLRQTYVQRAGHCRFTSAEVVAGVETLINRLNTGRWEGSTEPETMNQTAAALGLGSSAFTDWSPSLFLRPDPELP